MKPILFQIGPFPISSFGLFLLLAFVVSIALARRRAAPLGIDPSQMLDIALYMIIGGIVVGRLGYVVANLPTFAQEPVRIVTIWQDSGLVFYGAVLGGGAVAVLYARSRQIPLRRFLDVFAPPLAAGYAVAMIGALLHGLYLGRPTTVPWAAPAWWSLAGLSRSPCPRIPQAEGTRDQIAALFVSGPRSPVP